MQGEPEEIINNLARIFVWLRYSSARKLTWQRNYNTQPRILGEAQHRLTHAIAQVRRSSARSSLRWLGRLWSRKLQMSFPLLGKPGADHSKPVNLSLSQQLSVSLHRLDSQQRPELMAHVLAGS